MSKFWIGVLTGIAATVAVSETLKNDKVKRSIGAGKERIYDAIGDLVDRIDPGVPQ